jgi:energy-coupling factor transporter ATP-binding protein EcfA2
MLAKVEALNYRALRYVSQSIDPYQVLIGPNASGKSTFLDVLAFIADLVSKPSLIDAVRERAPDLRDLTWMRSSDWLELAVEAKIPQFIDASYPRLRYEIRLGVANSGELELQAETLWFISEEINGEKDIPLDSFPSPINPPSKITIAPTKSVTKGLRRILYKSEKQNDYFRSENSDWNNVFRLGPKRAALANLPEDESRFPAAVWFKRYISEGVQRIMLNSEALRRPNPPQSPRVFLPDGSNLPWVINSLEVNHPERLTEWVQHVQTALPDIRHIRTTERPEDRFRYLLIEYDSGLEAPSWTVSDGTLRMLALTILAYLPDLRGSYLIEEPENGIHPRAVETVIQSLRSVYDAQILLATHSPVILSLTEASELLCFARTADGETDIVRGDRHPRLAEWTGEVSLSTLYASGVLG